MAFFAIFPVNSIMSLCSTKDVIFSGLVLLCLVLALEVIESVSPKQKVKKLVILGVASVLMLLFRNNAIFAFLLLTGIYIFSMIFKKKQTKVCVYMMLVVGMYMVSNFLLSYTLKAEVGSVQEMFSIPAQIYGRIWQNVEVEKTLSENAIIEEMMEKYYPEPPYEYDPRIADPMKGGALKLKGESPAQYLISAVKYLIDSMKLFAKYPVVGMDAVLYLTKGDWYICDVSFANVSNYGMETRSGYLYTNYSEVLDVVHRSKFPQLEFLLEHAFSANEYQKMPILSVFFSPALYIWILLFCTTIFCKKGRYDYMLPVAFLWCLFLTILAGPVSIVRYMYPFFVCSPILICMACNAVQTK